MARTPNASPRTDESPDRGDTAQLPDLEDAVIVVHENGYELIETDASPQDSEEVTAFTDSLPGEDPDAAAFNADAHPETSMVGTIDDLYDDLDVKESLQQAWLDSGRLDVLVRDDVIKCVNPDYEDLTWFIAIEDGEAVHKDIDDEDVVQYHELDDYERDDSLTVEELSGSVSAGEVEATVVGRDELEQVQEEVA